MRLSLKIENFGEEMCSCKGHVERENETRGLLKIFEMTGDDWDDECFDCWSENKWQCFL